MRVKDLTQEHFRMLERGIDAALVKLKWRYDFDDLRQTCWLRTLASLESYELGPSKGAGNTKGDMSLWYWANMASRSAIWYWINRRSNGDQMMVAINEVIECDLAAPERAEIDDTTCATIDHVDQAIAMLPDHLQTTFWDVCAMDLNPHEVAHKHGVSTRMIYKRVKQAKQLFAAQYVLMYGAA